MANYTFHNPSGSSYFTYEGNRNSSGFYDSSSLKGGSGSFNDFTGSNADHVVQSDYIWSQVIPNGTSSFDFDGAVAVPISGSRFRGTGEFSVIITV